MSRSRIEAGNGGMPARRAVVRWTWRLMRRQRRQYTVIVVMLALAVAAIVFTGAAAYNLAPASGLAEFGHADTAVYYEADFERRPLEEWLAAGTAAFDTLEVMGHRPVVIPGTAEVIDFRAQDPDGLFSAPMLAVTSGRAPAGDAEVAITNGVGELLGIETEIGATVDVDGIQRTVVGIVENPNDLGDEFVLVDHAAIDASDTVVILTDASEQQLRAFGDAVGGMKVSGLSDVPEDVLAGVLTLLAGTVVLALVALVASASFNVIAQRRLTQLGMLEAIGATQRHLRLSMLASGALTGLVASVLGGIVGVIAWFGLSTPMESVVGFRIDPTHIGWWLVLAGIVLAVLAATLAAWWPARSLAKVPTVVALSGRMPRPRTTRRSAWLAPALVGAGAVMLYFGSDFGSDAPSLVETVLLIGGTLTLVAGVLLASPLIVRWLGRLARSAPLATRIALRDLGRYQARSSAALAAIGLALGIPAVIVAATAAAENAEPLGNLANTQLIVRVEGVEGPFIPGAEQVANAAAGAQSIAEVVGAQSSTALEVALDPDMPPDPNIDQRIGVSIDRQDADGFMFLTKVYVATPALLDALDLDADSVAGGDVATIDDGDDLALGPYFRKAPPGAPGGEGPPEKQPVLPDTGSLPETYTSLPQALVDPQVATERGWTIQQSGEWLLEFDQALTPDQLDTARSLAAQHGLIIQSRDSTSALRTVRLAAGGVGMLLALAVLATTVGLMRSEAAQDMRTLTATGATGWVRRSVTASCAGALALGGAVLGVVSAYLGLAAGRVDHLTPLPWGSLAVLLVLTPVVATAMAWLLSGREPEAIARRPLD